VTNLTLSGLGALHMLWWMMFILFIRKFLIIVDDV
jgi:hypothetical protein